jgi:cytochrome P450
VAVVSLTDPAFLQDPYPAIAEHRHEGVVPNAVQGGWWVLDSETIRDLIRDPHSASDPELADPDAPITKAFKQARLSLFYMDPPDHTRIRGSIKADFTPRRVGDMEASIAASATALLEALPDAGVIDIAATYGDALPMAVMSDFLGVEQDRRDEFRAWTLTRIAGVFDPTKSTSEAFLTASAHLRDYFAERILAARNGPVEGLVGPLVDSGKLTDDEMIDLLVVMLGAGIITTADLIGNTLNALVDRPSEIERLRDDPELVPIAVEETLRYDSPALSAGRILTEEREMFGQRIPAGTWLRLMTAAVGRDPERNPDPDTYRLDRDARDYLAFGGGLHHCIGLHLGKLEAAVALRLLLERYPSISRAEVDEPAARRQIPGFRGFSRLMLDVR